MADVHVGRHSPGVVCQCPDIDGDHIHQVAVDPIPCGCCGKPLELSCGGQGSKRHQMAFIREARAREADRIKFAVRGQRRAPRPATYEEKRCGCGKIFTPTGPNTKRCPECREKYARGEL